MYSEKKVIINTKTIEIQIKKVIQALINQYIISKEQVTIIDFIADGTEKVLPPKEHLEVDITSLKNKIKSEYKAFKEIIEKLSNSKIKDFEINDTCFNYNFTDIISLINSIYDCQFKKIIDNVNIIEDTPKQSFNLLNFLIKYKLNILIILIIISIIIWLKYYKK